MKKSHLRSGISKIAFAVIGIGLATTSISSIAAPASPDLWQLQSGTSQNSVFVSLASRSDFTTGQDFILEAPDGALKTITLTEVQKLRLGGTRILGVSEDGGSSLDMVVVAGQAFGDWVVDNQSAYSIFSNAGNGPGLFAANSTALLSARVDVETLLRSADLLTSGPVVAWVSKEFEDRFGLASAARLEYLLSKVNAARQAKGLGAVELVATRQVDTADDPAFAASGVVVTSAKPTATDDELALVAAVLPSSRSVKTGVAATAFATVINPGASDATSCGLVMNGSGPAGVFHFQETDAANAPTGVEDQTVTIAGNAAQSFVFSFAANSAQDPGLELPIEFSCANRQSAVIVSGLNTLFFSASDVDVPDIIALSETGSAVGLNTNAGIVDMIDREKDGAFVVATSNVGASGTVTVAAASSAPASLPVSLLVCQTDPGTGACLQAPTSDVSLMIGAGETPSFAFFTSSDTVWPFDPANNRVNITFTENGAVRGSTSVALRTLQGTPALPATLVDYEAIAENLPAHFTQSTGMGPGQFTPQAVDNTPVDNPVTNAGATLGQVLFYDKRLSINDTVSCSSCHEQAIGFSDPDKLSDGFAGGKTGRHSMGLANARFYGPGAFFWDERAATLEDQVLMPIQDGVEMGMTLPVLLPKLEAVSFYPDMFNAAFGDNTITSDRISKALAQFVRSMVSSNSKFDQAYVNGTPDQPDFAGTFTSEEFLGAALFMPIEDSGVQSFGCVSCHRTTVQALDAVQNNGLDLNTDADQGAGGGAFKAPSLRNIAVRAPYMHDGRFGTLAEVIEFYNSGIQNHPNLSPRLRQGGPNGQPRRFNMTDQQKAALEAFLGTLTDQGFITDSRYADPFLKK